MHKTNITSGEEINISMFKDEFGKRRAGWLLFPNRSTKRNCLFRLFFLQFSITTTTVATATIITAAGADLVNVRQQCQVVTRERALTNRPVRGGTRGGMRGFGLFIRRNLYYIGLRRRRSGKIGSLRFTRLKAVAGKGTTHTHTAGTSVYLRRRLYCESGR